MLFRQLMHEDLACASYVLSDGREAAVVDPKWDVGDYLALAAEHGFRITHVLETHVHADHLSGHGRLAEATGATIHVPAGADVDFAHEELADGDVVELGPVRLEALATPGHRPEHHSFLVAETTRSDGPWLVLTGDSLFVGDVGRPDLAVEPEEGARDLCHSLRRLFALPAHVEVWPAHIGGSLCGSASMSEKPSSTIGFERLASRLLLHGEEAFVHDLLSRLQPQPPAFERIVELNSGPLVTESADLAPVAPAQVQRLAEDGAIVLDGRSPREFDGTHVPGSINVTTMRSGVGTRAAWVVELDREVLVAAATDDDARLMGRMLEAAGFGNLRGFLAGGVDAWQEAGLPVETTAAIDVAGLAEQLRSGEAVLLDVREDDEWREGHVEGSLHVPFHELSSRIPEEIGAAVDGKALAVVCSAGIRSSIAVSLLQRAGIERLEHVVEGGVADLAEHGLELASDR
jgi:hydroxyacylglutathione hydrolase